MFSLPKLLMLFGLLWAVWLVFRLIDRRNQARDEGPESGQETGQQTSRRDEPPADRSVDLSECERCGAYVPAGGCDKSDCPLKS